MPSRCFGAALHNARYPSTLTRRSLVLLPATRTRPILSKTRIRSPSILTVRSFNSNLPALKALFTMGLYNADFSINRCCSGALFQSAFLVILKIEFCSFIKSCAMDFNSYLIRNKAIRFDTFSSFHSLSLAATSEAKHRTRRSAALAYPGNLFDI